eukprot:sb/3475513/
MADYSESDPALVCCGGGDCECSPDSTPNRDRGVLDSLQMLFASNQPAAPSSKQQINIPPPADKFHYEAVDTDRKLIPLYGMVFMVVGVVCVVGFTGYHGYRRVVRRSYHPPMKQEEQSKLLDSSWS